MSLFLFIFRCILCTYFALILMMMFYCFEGKLDIWQRPLYFAIKIIKTNLAVNVILQLVLNKPIIKSTHKKPVINIKFVKFVDILKILHKIQQYNCTIAACNNLLGGQNNLLRGQLPTQLRLV